MKFAKALLFPHAAIMIILVFFSVTLLIPAMAIIGSGSVLAVISYVLSAYTLTVWCIRIPGLIKCIKKFKDENKYARRWISDTRLRINVSLYGSLAWNILYGGFQIWLGFYHSTFWFYSLGAYYICLAVMRFFLVGHTRKHAPGEKMRSELLKYRACGWVFLAMNLALSLIVFFMVYWNRSFQHHMITAIAVAAYTFTAFTVAVVNLVKYRKYNSPVFSASKAISFAAACVSMLTLEATMLTAFSDGSMTESEQKWLLGATGGAISVLIVFMAIYMIAKATKRLEILRSEVENG